MNSDDFYAAKIIEVEGWEFLGLSENNEMIFSRSFGGLIFRALVSEDR